MSLEWWTKVDQGVTEMKSIPSTGKGRYKGGVNSVAAGMSSHF